MNSKNPLLIINSIFLFHNYAQILNKVNVKWACFKQILLQLKKWEKLICCFVWFDIVMHNMKAILWRLLWASPSRAEGPSACCCEHGPLHLMLPVSCELLGRLCSHSSIYFPDFHPNYNSSLSTSHCCHGGESDWTITCKNKASSSRIELLFFLSVLYRFFY